MSYEANYQGALARFDRKLRVLAETPPQPVGPVAAGPHVAAGHPAHGDLRIEACVEIAHYFLAGVAPFHLVQAGACAPANDHAAGGLSTGRHGRPSQGKAAVQPSTAFDYLPGPLQQACLQLLSSLGTACLPALVPHRGAGRTSAKATIESRLRGALRASTPSILGDAAIAGLSDVITEVVGWMTREVDQVCQRLLHAIRHAMFPALKALRLLFWRDGTSSRREALDLALKLFVQAGIVATCVVAEHELALILKAVFGDYAGVVARFCMGALCFFACHRAIVELDELDPVGAREHREVVAELRLLRIRRAENDRRLDAVLALARSNPQVT